MIIRVLIFVCLTHFLYAEKITLDSTFMNEIRSAYRHKREIKIHDQFEMNKSVGENNFLWGDKTPVYRTTCDSAGKNIQYSKVNFTNRAPADANKNSNVKKSSKPSKRPKRNTNNSNVLDNDIFQKSFNSKKSSTNHDVEILTIEVLITVDYETFKSHGKNLNSLIKYMTSFWHSVDQKFKQMSDPKLRLNIAGLIVPQSPECAPYIENHVLKRKMLNIHSSLKNMSKYFATNPLNAQFNYDMVMGMTSRSIYDPKKTHNGKLRTSGLALTGTLCGTKINAGAALIKDQGDFQGVLSAVHEIGHVIGLGHDDEVSNSVKAGKLCSEFDKGEHIMDSVGGGSHWSACSIKTMQQLLRSELYKCLQNKPDVGKPKRRVLPGKILNRNEQCKISTGFEAYLGSKVDIAESCKNLTCIEYRPDRSITYHTVGAPPAEGTSCGHGKICLDGTCVEDPDPSRKNLPPPRPPTRDETCRKYTGFGAYAGGIRSYTNNCEKLTCYDDNGGVYVFPPEPPAEGSDCGYGGICQAKSCIINPKILQGKVPPPAKKTREDQCQKINSSWRAQQRFGDCASELKCQTIEGTITYTRWIQGNLPEDGTECDEGKVCYDSQCVSYSELFSNQNVKI